MTHRPALSALLFALVLPLAACTGQACSAHDVLPVLFKRALNQQQMTFAMGEAVAHLHALWHAGQVQRHQDPVDSIYRFRAPTT